MEKQKDNSDHNDTKNDTRDVKSIKFSILNSRRKMVKTISTIHFLEDCISNHIIPNTFIDKITNRYLDFCAKVLEHTLYILKSLKALLSH